MEAPQERWRKSSRSDAEGACVEVAALPGAVGVRDSKDPAGPRIAIPAGAWRPLIAALKAR